MAPRPASDLATASTILESTVELGFTGRGAAEQSSRSSGEGAVLEPSATARENLIQQEEHAANVVCLQRALRAGSYAWPLFIPLDYLVSTQLSLYPFEHYLSLRFGGWLIILAGALRLRSARPIGPLSLKFIDSFVFVQAAVIVSIMCLSSGGLTSPYAAGIPVIMICRAAFTAQFWKDAVLPNALMAVAYPAVLLGGALFSPMIRAQLSDPPALVHGLVYTTLVLCTMLFAVLGGHTRWALRRQLFRARTVGRYRVLRRLGGGGMGEVWAADHRGLKRQVAIKVLRPEDRFDPVALIRFEREAQAMSRLTHPNTVRVFDYGVSADGLWYYAMELLDGQDLAALLAKEGPLSARRSVHLLLQATRALAEAHALGIIHRDIKPQNLFVTSAGGEPDVVKVLDFGIAKVQARDAHGTLSRVGWIGGTPAYISPEVAAGEQADARSDQYSLGATLFFALTGEPPFAALSNAGLMHAHVNTPPRAPSELVADVPPELDAIVLRCLAKQPAARYDSVNQLAEALAAL
ncbi:MAG TPA: serine/threonine-protein kinase [Polyangiaceae bacterium]